MLQQCMVHTLKQGKFQKYICSFNYINLVFTKKYCLIGTLERAELEGMIWHKIKTAKLRDEIAKRTGGKMVLIKATASFNGIPILQEIQVTIDSNLQLRHSFNMDIDTQSDELWV